MLNRTSSGLFVSFTSLVLLVHCGSDPASNDSTNDGGTPTAGNTGNTGGGQTTGQSTANSGAGNGNGNSSNGTTQGANTTSPQNTSAGNTTNGAVNTTSGNSTGAGQTTTASSTTSGAGGGNTSDGAASTTGGPDIDQGGKMNAAPGAMTDVPQDYLRLGEIRILNNNWGSEDLGCTAPNSTMSVFVNDSRAFGWNFNRGDCAQPQDSSHPDFPQVEFGIHPFGINSPLETSPPFSSTTVLPIQIKDIEVATITLDNFNIQLNAQDSWNITWEFWLSQGHPVNEANPGVYAEIMGWWGWDAGRWPCDMDGNTMTVETGGTIQGGAQAYSLCHQDDTWADGWRYYQYRAGDGSDGNIRNNFSGVVDIKPFLTYLMNEKGYSGELWLTRMEVGSEIDDNTGGTVTMNNVTFQVNDQIRSAVIGE